MSVYAISDLHLSSDGSKPMDVFGLRWQHHAERLEENWRAVVRPEDWVLIPGDISWGMRLADAAQDFAFLDRLPGKKLIGRGNHDYYWLSHQKMQEFLPDSIQAADRQTITTGEFTLVATKGWLCPGSGAYTAARDEKLYLREVQRLRLVLQQVKDCERPLIAMLHFPPMNEKNEISGFTQLLDEFQVKLCIYGHLHGPDGQTGFNGKLRQTRYQLVAADYLCLKPLCLDEWIFAAKERRRS
ncbi:MAG: metallophosphoesterase [Negativicutes bacterium]|nr:metallophosphoesterase [Negativicutes bacterium]